MGLDEYTERETYFLYYRWARNAKALFDKGIDPYQVFIRRCREKGLSPWLGPRMNDGHDGAIFGKNHPYRSTNFWRQHREFHFDPKCDHGDWVLHNLDYRHSEVRQYALLMLRELFERYDMDGVYLNGRCSWFPQAVARESEPVFEGFISEISNLRDEWSVKRGRKILLGILACSIPEACRERGYDVAKYLREGKLDWAICGASGFKNELWRREIAPRKDAVILLSHPNVIGMGKGLPLYNPSASDLRGWVDVHAESGADGCYLYNVEYSPKTQFEICRNGLLPKDVGGLSRSYRLWSPEKGTRLPVKMDRKLKFAVYVGNPLGTASLLFGFRELAPSGINVRINGIKADWEYEERVVRTRFEERKKGQESLLAFEYNGRRVLFPEGTVRKGENAVEIEPCEGSEITYLELQLN